MCSGFFENFEMFHERFTTRLHGMSIPFESDDSDAFADFLRQFLGDSGAEDALASLRAQGIDPGQLASQLPGGDFQAAFGQFHHILNSTSGPVNWSVALDMARQQVYQAGDPAPVAAQASEARQAMTVADLWLDAVTDFSPGVVDRQVWSRRAWLENTVDTWKRIAEPVAKNVSRALTEALTAQLGGDLEQAQAAAFTTDGAPAFIGAAKDLLPRLSAMMFAAHLGEALSALGQESFGSTDVGLPLGPAHTTALVVHNVSAFAQDLDMPSEEVVQFLAVRECAHQRLFASVPWLASDLIHAVESYSGEIALDHEAIAAAARDIDPSDPNSMNMVIGQEIFTSNQTPRQAAALDRLETLLALVEGWVELVTRQATLPYLPHCEQLTELMRRRRATGAPAEAILGHLLGMKMRPRQARGAAQLMSLVEADGGRSARDHLWHHPDFIPTSSDLVHPESYLLLKDAVSDEVDELDAELEKLLDGTLGWADGLGPDVEPES